MLCNTEHSLLLVIDLQTRLARAMPDNDANLMLNNSCKLVRAAGLLDIPVLVTEQYPKGLGATATKLTGCLPAGTPVFTKTGFSCCAAPDFDKTLSRTNRKQIILMGMETHVCILQSALELAVQNYQVHVVEDAVCSRKLEHKLYALQRMQQQGITVSCHESVLFEWIRDASHPEFKTIAKMLS